MFKPIPNCPSAKKRYETENEALIAARDGMFLRTSPQLSVYHCLQCMGYHLTSRPVKVSKKKTKGYKND